jgi:2-methylisocitrate lyase-like PEP mutase family enzyme
LPGSRPVISSQEHAKKIEVACAARNSTHFIIIARPDAAGAHGIDEAIRRVKAYRAAGADIVFVELKAGPDTIDHFKRVTAEIDAPVLANVDEGGVLSDLTIDQLEAIGFRLVIYPGLARYAAGYAIREGLAVLNKERRTTSVRSRMLTVKEYNEVLRLGDVEAWERKYL